MQLLFVSSESTFTYFEATRGYLERYGKPLAFYSDKASVFRINNRQATGEDGQTQFGRAMNELNITGICANTSSAKGRLAKKRTFKNSPDKGIEFTIISLSVISRVHAAPYPETG